MAVLLVAGLRFAVTGVYELTGQEPSLVPSASPSPRWPSTRLRAQLEGAAGRTALPLLRRGSGRRALEGSVQDQLEGVETEAGVRKTL